MSQAAFMATFTEYGDAIFRFCLVKVTNKELAEDMTQEVFMRYWQYLQNGKEIGNTRALLYTIAHNMAKDWYKRKKAVSLDQAIEAGHEPAGTLSGPEADASYAEVLRAMSELEENDRMVLHLRFTEGLPPQDVAAILNETPNVISVRITRATKRLQLSLGL